MPVFPSGAGGLVSTVDDWHSFGRMLLAQRELSGPTPTTLMRDFWRYAAGV